MPIWRLQVAIGADTAFPRDRIVITPHFNDSGVGTDPDNLCEQLADALVPYFGQAREIIVKAYDAQGTAPVFPQGEATRSLGIVPKSNLPREVALCLSFYGTRNLPRQRGRLYIPMGQIYSAADVRPSTTQMQKVADLAPILQAVGGADVDWCVYSPTTNTAHSVTNWWVDDEWDTIRSRGLRSITRLTGTTGEG